MQTQNGSLVEISKTPSTEIAFAGGDDRQSDVHDRVVPSAAESTIRHSKPDANASLHQPYIQSFDGEPDDISLLDGHASVDAGFTKEGAGAHRHSGVHKEVGEIETQMIRVIRIVFGTILFVSAIAMGSAFLFFSLIDEVEAFEANFDAVTMKLVTAFHESVRMKIGVMESLVISIISYSRIVKGRNSAVNGTSENGAEWPFVTIPDFAALGINALTLADLKAITYFPRVEENQRLQWEEFASNNLDWIEEGPALEENWTQTNDTTLTSSPPGKKRSLRPQHIISSKYELSRRWRRALDTDEGTFNRTQVPHFIHGHGGDGLLTEERNSELKMHFFPMWQTSPVPPLELINYDLSSSPEFSGIIDHILAHKDAAVGPVVDDDGKPELSFFKQWKESWMTLTTEYATDVDGSHLEEPGGNLLVPVLDRLRKSPSAYRNLQSDRSQDNEVGNLQIDSRVSGIIMTTFVWGSFFRQVLPPATPPVSLIIRSNCGDNHTYLIEGESVKYVGRGDLHDRTFDSYQISSAAFVFNSSNESAEPTFGNFSIGDQCNFTLNIYPTNNFESRYRTSRPWFSFGIVTSMFTFTAILIGAYECAVQIRQNIVAQKAAEAGAIVSSIYPEAVQKKLYGEDDGSRSRQERARAQLAGFASSTKVPSAVGLQKKQIKSFLDSEKLRTKRPSTASGSAAFSLPDTEEARGGLTFKSPIVYNFPSITIMFADIVGFTAWSSQREPNEVFLLLQTLYHEFDRIAKRDNTFKVETVGDCYVAASGIPEPRKDHAQRITRFAIKCMMEMAEITRDFEVRFGPDTGELKMRVGLHSGPVTAGVLQGAKCRFQIFGDAMNMASRMMSNSLPGKIQCSEATAILLWKAGKRDWTRPRSDLVQAKGKGQVQTYWISQSRLSRGVLYAVSRRSDSSSCDESHTGEVLLSSPDGRLQRLIDWNVEILSQFLRQIEAKRQNLKKDATSPIAGDVACPQVSLAPGSSALDEVTEIIALPQEELLRDVTQRTSVSTDTSKKKARDTKSSWHQRTKTSKSIELDYRVVAELRDYVTTIAFMYRDNAFHNFEHASHVTMCTNKLLKRVTVRDSGFDTENEDQEHGHDHRSDAADLHDYTLGIRSDPLTQFALVFCALVHDVDHAGVSNFQLIAENAGIARLYRNKSVAEQNSVDLAWDLFVDPTYDNLRKAICSNNTELKRFRQLMVNIVLATDIFDRNMKEIRERRWNKAFQINGNAIDDRESKEYFTKSYEVLKKLDAGTNGNAEKKSTSEIEGINLKATIVMEHLIQASDVAHTMQHWEVYLKWNERLLREMYAAFKAGRASKNPLEGWYEGEIMFFDKYIIPLARKLDDCGVFGVSSDECLNYALQNRKMWALKGEEIVEDYKTRCELRAPNLE